MPAGDETSAGNDSLSNRHPQLYHYTDGAGFKGIVESNSLRATYFGNLNDANEILERGTYFYLLAQLQAVHYPVEGASPIDAFESLISLSEGVIKKAVEGDRNFTTAELFVPFVESATAFKHRGFYEEREVRLRIRTDSTSVLAFLVDQT